MNDKKITNQRYQEYLMSPEWKGLKKQVINRAKGCCDGCGKQTELEVHHLTYERIGMELMSDLVAFCNFCHSKVHGKSLHTSWHLYIQGKQDSPKDIANEALTKALVGW